LCNTLWWLVPASLAAGLVYIGVLLLVSVRRHALWKSITYFMQVAPLVSPTSATPALAVALALFDLDPSALGLHISACPFPGHKAVLKMATSYLIPVVLLGELIMIYAAHAALGRFWSFCRSRAVTSINLSGDHHYSEAVKALPLAAYAGALMALVLLLFQSLMTSTMELLHCVPLGGGMRLFRSGNVECFAEWQYPLFAMLAILLPLPVLLPLVTHVLSPAGPSWGRRIGGRTSIQAVMSVVRGAYKPTRPWWEGVVLLRRAALTTAATFVIDPIWRTLAIFIISFVAAVAHFAASPFADRHYGAVEAAFLCDLALIAALQLPQAAFARLGLLLDHGTILALQYAQNALTILPMLSCVIVLLCKYVPALWTRTARRIGQRHWRESAAESGSELNGSDNRLDTREAYSLLSRVEE
jgi:hypothetical protein